MTTRKKEVWLRKNHCRKTLDDEEEGDGSGEYVDEEVENAIVNCTPSAPTTTGGGSSHKTIPWGRKFPLSVLPLALTLLRICRIILTESVRSTRTTITTVHGSGTVRVTPTSRQSSAYHHQRQPPTIPHQRRNEERRRRRRGPVGSSARTKRR